MKKLIDISKEESGLMALMGERITLFCINYIYTGRLTGVNDAYVLLEDPAIVYETGPFNTKDWGDAQSLPHEIHVMLSAVESFGMMK